MAGFQVTTEEAVLFRSQDRLATAGGSLLHRLPAARTDRAPARRDAGATNLRAGAGLRRPERSRATTARSAPGGIGWEARSLGTPGRQKYPEPAGTNSCRFPCCRTLQQDRLRSRSDRQTARHPVSGIAPKSAAIHRSGFRCDRHPVAWEAGSALLPWLLQPLLLSALVHFLWGPAALCALTALEYRCQCREPGGNRAHCRADPESLAAYPDHPARRLRVLPGTADGLVRKTRSRLRFRLRTKSTLASQNRQGDAPG